MVFIRMRGGTGESTAGLSAAIGALDVFFNPAAARAREELAAQHERVLPMPSPGDRLLDDGVVVIESPGSV